MQETAVLVYNTHLVTDSWCQQFLYTMIMHYYVLPYWTQQFYLCYVDMQVFTTYLATADGELPI